MFNRTRFLTAGLLLLFLGSLLFVGTARAALVNGYDWERVTHFSCAAGDKKYIKIIFLKLIYETSLFKDKVVFDVNGSGGKFFYTYKKDLYAYLGLIDKFYSKEENLKFPLFCALQIAVKIKSGCSEKEAEDYKQLLLERLKEYNIF